MASYTDLSLQYCDDVLTGKQIACLQIHQACQRLVDDLEAIDSDPSFPYTYSIEKAERVCAFAARLPHVSGRWAARRDNHFRIEPWQAFILTSIFGWVHKATGYRRFTEALISIPRKNGKSFLASVITLYMALCDGEPGAQCLIGANNLAQALTIFNPARLMLERTPALRDAFGVEVNVKSLLLADGGRVAPVVGIARDGASCHLACLDEYHEAKDDTLYQSLVQSMGARSQPLMLITSTSGYTLEGPMHSFQKEAEKILEGTIEREELFAFISTIDKGIDWASDDALQMANPNLGVSVNIDALRIEHRNAVANPSKQNAFKTKKLNIWCNSASAWLSMQKWYGLGDSTLRPEMFLGEPCWMGCDLSTKMDTTAVVKIFKSGDTFYLFPRIYLPAERAEDHTLPYAKWVAQGHLISQPGNVIDMGAVLADTVADVEKYKPQVFAFDSWRADMFTQILSASCPNLLLAEVPNQVKFISPGLREIETLVECGRLKHNDNLCMNWQMSNVSVFEDRKNNIYPRKQSREAKIDAVMALTYAMVRAMTNATAAPGMFQPFWL